MERLLEFVLSRGHYRNSGDPDMETLAREVRRYNPRDLHVVILGGGTGMSTVVGGNSQLPDWPDDPFDGLKSVFTRLDVVVVTTDDGGSTGQLLQHLPMIGIGDLRKSCLSLIRGENLLRTYDLNEQQVRDVVRIIHALFNYRFPEQGVRGSLLKNPLRIVPKNMRSRCPAGLESGLRELTCFAAGLVQQHGMLLQRHSLGNLLLTAAVFRAARRSDRAPGLGAMRRGLDDVARLIGVTPGHLFAATASPGQLVFRYSNGVEVCGQHKAGMARRGCPVQWLTSAYARRPGSSSRLRKALSSADVIIYAPGSLYSSMIPLLQVPSIAECVRANRHALKMLAANFWIQEGETDMSPTHRGRGYLVSDLIEAYARNVTGGIDGLFDVVLGANLEHIPGNILRNYALEGKQPIHLDRAAVEQLGLSPLEATLFSLDHLRRPGVIHHDAHNFTLAVKTLLYGHKYLCDLKRYGPVHPPAVPVRAGTPVRYPAAKRNRPLLLCDYLQGVKMRLAGKHFHPAALHRDILQILWDNRDILPSHLDGFSGIRLVTDKQWGRSKRWDNVLGFFDPSDRWLKLHESTADNRSALSGNLLIALGESVLGTYLQCRRWMRHGGETASAMPCYEIHLLPVEERRTFLADQQLHAYLQLARLIRDRTDPLVYRIALNGEEGFMPPGLLFGLMYAWYLDNRYGRPVEYEMSLLHWQEFELMPYQLRERRRRKALVAFFREQVFEHTGREGAPES
jgi:2-phospho-L-lactate transferase/gluconeogenesis factor (CofD/UPF0052 family)